MASAAKQPVAGFHWLKRVCSVLCRKAVVAAEWQQGPAVPLTSGASCATGVLSCSRPAMRGGGTGGPIPISTDRASASSSFPPFRCHSGKLTINNSVV